MVFICISGCQFLFFLFLFSYTLFDTYSWRTYIFTDTPIFSLHSNRIYPLSLQLIIVRSFILLPLELRLISTSHLKERENRKATMAESSSFMKSKFESIREWIVENKLRAVGGLWAGGVIGSLAYNWSQPAKPSVKIIHARLHAQALTLAALAGAAVVEYYDHNKSQKNSEQRFPKFLPNLDRNDS